MYFLQYKGFIQSESQKGVRSMRKRILLCLSTFLSLFLLGSYIIPNLSIAANVYYTNGTVIPGDSIVNGNGETEPLLYSNSVNQEEAATSVLSVYSAVDAYWNVKANGGYNAFKVVSGAGGDFLDFSNAYGSVDFTVNVETAGDYYLAVGWSTASDRAYNLAVNSEAVGTYNCTTNGGWTAQPLYHVAKVSLKAGANIVQVQHTESVGIPCISNLTVIPASEILTYADDPTLGGNAKAVVSDSGLDGYCFDTGNSSGTVTWNVTVPVSGTYKITVPYSTSREEISLSLLVDGNATDLSGSILSTKGYGNYWNFLTGQEVEIEAGESVPVTLSWSGGAYLGGLRLELVPSSFTITCVGDSVTEGYKTTGGLKGEDAYPAILSQLLAGDDTLEYVVHNYGKSSRTALKDNDYAYTKTQEYTDSLLTNPDAVIICLGTNDSKSGNWDAEQYKADYKALIQEYMNMDSKPTVYLAYTTYVKYYAEGDCDRETIQNEVLPIQFEIAAELGLKIIDLNTLTMNNTDKYADGIHPNDALQEMMGTYVYNALCSEGVGNLTSSDATAAVSMIEAELVSAELSATVAMNGMPVSGLTVKLNGTASAVSDADGKVSFTVQGLSLGDHIYTLTLDATDENGYDYDNTEKQITVSVAKDGSFSVSGNNPVFKNTYSAGTEETIYSLEIVWDDNDSFFNYVAGVQGMWNPEKHAYEETVGAGWTDSDLVVTVINHSNVGVKVSMEVSDADETDDLTITSDKKGKVFVETEGSANDKVIYTLTIDGKPTPSVAKVATITISFEAA